LSLATAAFVLTGCVIEEAEKHEIVLTLSTGATPDDATVRLTIENGDKWDSTINAGVRSGLVWTFNPPTNAPSSSSVVPTRISDTQLDFTFVSSTDYTGTVSINSFSDSIFRLYTESSSGATYYGSGATVTINDNLPVNIVVGAVASTVTLSDGTSGDNKVTLTLTGTTWKSPFPTTGWGQLWLFDPAEGTPTKVTVSQKSTTEVECAFTGATYTGNVEIDTTATFFNVLKGLTNIGSGTMAAAGSPVKIVVTTTSQEESGDDDDEPTIDDLVTALNTLTSGAVTKADSTHVNFVGSKTVTILSGTTITIPTGVTLTVASGSVSGAKITLNGGTLKVDGTLSVKGADLDVSSTASTIEGEGVIEKNTGNTYPVLALTGSQKLTIKDVTVKGTTGQSQPVISVTGTAELTLDGAVITGNTSGGNGGGLSIAGTAKVTLLNDAEVKGNTAAKGGGVYIANSGELHIESGTVYGTKGYASPADDAALTDELEANKNTATASNGFGGAAIYLASATTRVYGGEDDAYEITETEGDYFSTYFTNDSSTSGAAYMDKSIHSNTNGVYSKAAR
jgi:hypothetical protein